MTTDNRPVAELIAEAEAAPEPGNFDRRRVIHSMSDEFPIDVTVASLESSGYVYIYDTETAERSITSQDRLTQKLQQLRPNKARYFTTVKPDFVPHRGTLKCLLHPDDPNRRLYASWGFAECTKANLTTEFQVTRHVQVRHRMEWQTIEAERERAEREEERNFQRQLLASFSGQAPQTQASDTADTVDTAEDYTDCGCGEAIRSRYIGQHRKSKKHQRWEKRHGSQHG